MNLTYAVPDLHGAADLLDKALAAIERHAAGMPAGGRTVVFLGDYVDRGPGSRQIIVRLMQGPSHGWRWLCLKGNHEDIMLQALRSDLPLGSWIDTGGGATLLSYGRPAKGDHWPDFIPAAHVNWIAALPLLAVDKHRVFVHAGVDPSLPLEDQVEHDLMWSRTSNRLGHAGRFVVHGHTPHLEGPIVDGESIDLDTLAWKSGRLVVGVFDEDMPGGPTRILEVLRSE